MQISSKFTSFKDFSWSKNLTVRCLLLANIFKIGERCQLRVAVLELTKKENNSSLKISIPSKMPQQLLRGNRLKRDFGKQSLNASTKPRNSILLLTSRCFISCFIMFHKNTENVKLNFGQVVYDFLLIIFLWKYKIWNMKQRQGIEYEIWNINPQAAYDFLFLLFASFVYSVPALIAPYQVASPLI